MLLLHLSTIRSRRGLADTPAPAPVVDPLPADEFKLGLVDLSRDLIIKEQQIEVLISSLPGLDNSERDQERYIRELEDDLRAAEAQRQEAIREKEEVLAKVDRIIQGVRRP